MEGAATRDRARGNVAGAGAAALLPWIAGAASREYYSGFCFSALVKDCLSRVLPAGLPATHKSEEHGQKNLTVSLLRESERADAWRKLAGALSCLRHGVGPSGGFCLPTSINGKNKHNIAIAQSSCFNAALAATYASRDFAGNGSLLDLGCGTGAYGRWLRENAPVVSWLRIDGAENVEESTGGLVRFADLGDGLPRFARQRRWDWVMSVEVAEHLPRSLEPIFIHNLVSPRPRGIVLSWARVGQTGHHHVNCQSHQYVQCVLDLFGYRTDARRTALLLATLKHAPGRRATCSWLSPNLQVFSRRSAPSSKLGFVLTHASADFSAAYLRLTKDRCPYTRATVVRNRKHPTLQVCQGTCGNKLPYDRCRVEGSDDM